MTRCRGRAPGSPRKHAAVGRGSQLEAVTPGYLAITSSSRSVYLPDVSTHSAPPTRRPDLGVWLIHRMNQDQHLEKDAQWSTWRMLTSPAASLASIEELAMTTSPAPGDGDRSCDEFK